MEHELKRLDDAAARLTADLRRTIGDEWQCSVGKQYTVTLTGPDVHEALRLDRRIDESWYVRAEFSPDRQAEALGWAADDLVASAVSYAFEALGTPWPICSEHGQPASNCDGSWYCSSDATRHDLGPLGALSLEALSLGDLDPATPNPRSRALTLTPLSMEQARAAADIVATGALILECGPLRAIVFDDMSVAVGTAAAATALLRTEPSIVLWLEENDGLDAAGGIVVALNGKISAAHTWDGAAEAEPGDAAAMARALGVPDRAVALRALLRRAEPPRRLLAEAVELLDLPAQSVELLLQAHLDQVGLPAPDGRRGRYQRAYRAAQLIPLPRTVALFDRYQWILPAGVACTFFIRAGVAAVADTGTATGDVIGFSALGTVSALAAGLALRRSRRSARRQGMLGQHPHSTPPDP